MGVSVPGQNTARHSTTTVALLRIQEQNVAAPQGEISMPVQPGASEKVVPINYRLQKENEMLRYTVKWLLAVLSEARRVRVLHADERR